MKAYESVKEVYSRAKTIGLALATSAVALISSGNAQAEMHGELGVFGPLPRSSEYSRSLIGIGVGNQGNGIAGGGGGLDVMVTSKPFVNLNDPNGKVNSDISLFGSAGIYSTRRIPTSARQGNEDRGANSRYGNTVGGFATEGLLQNFEFPDIGTKVDAYLGFGGFFVDRAFAEGKNSHNETGVNSLIVAGVRATKGKYGAALTHDPVSGNVLHGWADLENGPKGDIRVKAEKTVGHSAAPVLSFIGDYHVGDLNYEDGTKIPLFIGAEARKAVFPNAVRNSEKTNLIFRLTGRD